MPTLLTGMFMFSHSKRLAEFNSLLPKKILDVMTIGQADSRATKRKRRFSIRCPLVPANRTGTLPTLNRSLPINEGYR